MNALVWFSHPPDYAKLAESIEHCRKLDPSARRIVVIESAHERPEVDAEIITRDFSRGFHLNGEEAVRGVAATLAEIDADLVVKIDSDMMPSRAFWLDGATVFQRFNNSFVGLYALPRVAFPVICQLIAEQPKPGHHEAQAIASRGLTICRALGIPINLTRTPEGVYFPEILTT
jgi:hypothetical protein